MTLATEIACPHCAGTGQIQLPKGGARLRTFRRMHKLTLQQVARHVGVSTATVSRWETKKISPGRLKLRFVAKLASLFNVSMDELVG